MNKVAKVLVVSIAFMAVGSAAQSAEASTSKIKIVQFKRTTTFKSAALVAKTAPVNVAMPAVTPTPATPATPVDTTTVTSPAAGGTTPAVTPTPVSPTTPSLPSSMKPFDPKSNVKPAEVENEDDEEDND